LNPPDEAPFTEPWQAQAFALAVCLSQRGVFAWPDFSAALADQIACRAEWYRTSDYYECWLDALELLVVEAGLADEPALHALEHAWADAYRRTPHGQPVRL
jgi:nitrile hydratase accessory protein